MLSSEIVKNNQESIAEITAEFREKYDSVKLQPNVVSELAPDFGTMSDAMSPKTGVYQYLRSVVIAGEEIFGVVDVVQRDPDTFEIKGRSTILSHHRPNDRASIIGEIIDGRPLAIGRDHQKDEGYKRTTSGNHFSIAKSSDGTIGIIDNSSTNGTEVFSIESVKANKFGFGTEKSYKRYKADLLNNVGFWSPKSSEIVDLVS